MNDYKAFGRFAPIYDSAVDQIFESVPAVEARQVEKVLRCYASYASPVGTCYPSIDKIRRDAHYSETTVKRALTVLSNLDMIRVHVEWRRARRKHELTYQINPRVMWITPDNIKEALELWSQAKNHPAEFFSLHRNVMFNGHPTPEPESEPDKTEPTPLSKDRTNTTTTKQPSKDGEPGGGESSEQREAQESEKQREARKPNRAKPGNQNPPPVPPPPPAGTLKDPLDDGAAESLAQQLAHLYGTRLVQARQLVIQHGVDRVCAGIAWIDIERARGSVKNPFGLLKWWLENHIIRDTDAAAAFEVSDAPVDPQPAPEPQSYLADEYRDFINH